MLIVDSRQKTASVILVSYLTHSSMWRWQQYIMLGDFQWNTWNHILEDRILHNQFWENLYFYNMEMVKGRNVRFLRKALHMSKNKGSVFANIKKLNPHRYAGNITFKCQRPSYFNCEMSTGVKTYPFNRCFGNTV